MNIQEFYKQATGIPDFTPYPYQARLATCEELPEVLSVPTGVGKTAAAVLSWIYRRRFAAESVQSVTPRRLVYCLPMRTLVEQTHESASQWLCQLGLQDSENPIGVHLLMGGADDGKWYEHPEQDAILIGTQDMLLSRALNRGYGMSRYAWPVQYALLNNDCLWVMDETQLMGVGLTTSAQLEGFRKKLNTYGNCQTLWMSATLDADAIATIDHPKPDDGKWTSETIEDDDRANENVQRVLNASKPCEHAELSLSPDTKKNYCKQLAELIHKKHQSNTLTLVVMNRVQRAQDTFKELQKLNEKEDSAPDIKLIHSRFRPEERQAVQAEALDDKKLPVHGRILIATQAIEAGVDLSSTTLITELAPWSSLVQRFGRCNRRGTCGVDGNPPARVLWVDIDTTDPKKAANEMLPYDVEDLNRARIAISACDNVDPAKLSEIEVETPQPILHMLRRKDLLDLFDTTADLSGNDLDVSRYIRESEDTDVQVYWREWMLDSKKTTPPPIPHEESFPAPQRSELCAVPIGQIRNFIDKLNKKDSSKHLCWCWNPLEKKWEEVRKNESRPGMTLLLHSKAGGYDALLGWTAEFKHRPVRPYPPDEEDGLLQEAYDSDDTGDQPLTVQQHLKDVGESAKDLKQTSGANWDEHIPWAAIIRSAWWHDVGKAHPAFQGAMRAAAEQELDEGKLYAKSGGKAYLKYLMPIEKEGDNPVERKGFRHELASALAWLQQHEGEEHSDLVAYLIAAHHGKVRLSIRSMPNEVKTPDANRLFARGIWQDDELPGVEIGNADGDISETCKLDLNLMQLGEYTDEAGNTHQSWLSRTLQLREQYGPFQLAYLETLVRVADRRGSAKGRNS